MAFHLFHSDPAIVWQMPSSCAVQSTHQQQQQRHQRRQQQKQIALNCAVLLRMTGSDSWCECAQIPRY